MVVNWLAGGAGSLGEGELALWPPIAVAGVQIFFASFVLAILGLRRPPLTRGSAHCRHRADRTTVWSPGLPPVPSAFSKRVPGDVGSRCRRRRRFLVIHPLVLCPHPQSQPSRSRRHAAQKSPGLRASHRDQEAGQRLARHLDVDAPVNGALAVPLGLDGAIVVNVTATL
jgi:hypothetical protein